MFYVDLAVAPPLGVDFLLNEAGLQDGDVDKLQFGLWTDRLHPTDLSRAETGEARERSGLVSRAADEWSFLKAGDGEDCGIDLANQLQRVALPRCRELLDPSALLLLAEDPRNGGVTFTYGRKRAAAILLAQRNGPGDFERALDMLSGTGNQQELADWLVKIRPSL